MASTTTIIEIRNSSFVSYLTDLLLSNKSNGIIQKRRIVLVFSSLLLVSLSLMVLTPSWKVESLASSNQSGVGLVLSIRPPVLPADGGSYSAIILQFRNFSSSLPFVPSSNVSVFLTSSSPQAGTVPNHVIFPADQTFLVLNFSTTTLPGNTTISAVAAGYQLATLNVETKTVGGIPNSLEVFLSPNVIPPDKKITSQVVVEAVDAFGNPVELGSNLNVQLSSSNTQIGSVPSTLTIPAGESFASAAFSPTYVAGTTTITASAGNYSAGSAVMTTTGPVARKLILSGPSVIPASSGQTALLSIQLQDNQSATPALAPSPVSIVLTSNNTQVASLSSAIVTIPAGSSYTTVTISSQGGVGSANITASAQGYVKGSIIVTSVLPANSANSLSEYFVPSTMLPNNVTYPGALEVQLQYYNSTSGLIVPAISQSSITIYARSSNNATMQVSTEYQGTQGISGIISSGQSEVGISVSSTFLPGTAEVTAQSPGLASSTTSLLSFGPAPNALRLYFAPSTILSDGRTYSSVTVGLIDNSTGQPARAPLNTIVNLASNVGSVGQVQSQLTIPAGQTYARASFATFAVNGSTLITASASNFTSTNKTLALVTKAASALGLYASPNSVWGNGQIYSSVVVQLQDSSGNPEKTDVPVTVQLSIRNSSVASVPNQVVIPPGSTFAQIGLNSSVNAGSTNITAVATGFKSSQVGVSTYLNQFQVTTSTTLIRLLPGQSTNVSVLVLFNGAPVSGASVNWSATLGSFTSVTNVTDSNGTAIGTYLAGHVPGAVLFNVKVVKPGFTTFNALNSVRILNSSATAAPTNSNIFEMKLVFIPVWVIIVIAVAVPSALFVVIKKRSASSYSADEEE